MQAAPALSASLCRSRGHLLRTLGRAAVAVLVAVTLAGCGSARADVPAPGPMVGTPLDVSLPASVLRVPLVSSTGAHGAALELHRQGAGVSDVMTLCQETCPLDTANVVAAARDVEQAGLGDKVEFVSITVDPQPPPGWRPAGGCTGRRRATG